MTQKAKDRVTPVDQQNQRISNFGYGVEIKHNEVEQAFADCRDAALDPYLDARTIPPAMLYRYYKYMVLDEAGPQSNDKNARLDFIKAVNQYTGLEAKTLTGLNRGLTQLVDTEKQDNQEQHGLREQGTSVSLAGLGVGFFISGAVLALSNPFGAVISGVIASVTCAVGVLYASAFMAKVHKDREQYAHNERLSRFYETLQQAVDKALNHVLSPKEKQLDELWQKYYDVKNSLAQYKEQNHLSFHALKQTSAKRCLQAALKGLNNDENVDLRDIDQLLSFAQCDVGRLDGERGLNREQIIPRAKCEDLLVRFDQCVETFQRTPVNPGYSFAYKMSFCAEIVISSYMYEGLSNQEYGFLDGKLAELEQYLSQANDQIQHCESTDQAYSQTSAFDSISEKAATNEESQQHRNTFVSNPYRLFGDSPGLTGASVDSNKCDHGSSQSTRCVHSKTN